MDCIFIGYAHNNSIYKIRVYESNILDFHKSTITESRNASFLKQLFPYKSKMNLRVLKRIYEAIIEDNQRSRTRI